MTEVRAYEAEGKLFKTEEEARVYVLEVGLKRLFSGKDGYQMMSEICNRKPVRERLVKLIQEMDMPETEDKGEKDE